jgi:hypothetical protein
MRGLFIVACCLLIGCGHEVVQSERIGAVSDAFTGSLADWPESEGTLAAIRGQVRYDPEGLPSPETTSGLMVWWSIANVPSQQSYWYGSPDTMVARAADIGHVSELTDAATGGGYVDDNVQLLSLGHVVAWRVDTDEYLVVRVDAIEGGGTPMDYPIAVADVTYYYSADADFSEFSEAP